MSKQDDHLNTYTRTQNIRQSLLQTAYLSNGAKIDHKTCILQFSGFNGRVVLVSEYIPTLNHINTFLFGINILLPRFGDGFPRVDDEREAGLAVRDGPGRCCRLSVCHSCAIGEQGTGKFLAVEPGFIGPAREEAIRGPTRTIGISGSGAIRANKRGRLRGPLVVSGVKPPPVPAGGAGPAASPCRARASQRLQPSQAFSAWRWPQHRHHSPRAAPQGYAPC